MRNAIRFNCNKNSKQVVESLLSFNNFAHSTNYGTTQRLSIVFAYEIDASQAVAVCMHSRKHELSFMGKIVLLYWTGIGHISWFTGSNTCIVSCVSMFFVLCVRSEEKQKSSSEVSLYSVPYAKQASACHCVCLCLSRLKNKLVQEHHDALKFNLCSFFALFLLLLRFFFLLLLFFFLVHDFCAHWIYWMCALLLQAMRFNINNL